ncbi:MAG: hydrogenase nickel incorporation protein HypB [Candidatus Marinimicrobia bacterium]|nr:hydrogenase nickel incorporation protein HypB [Candidatus Neomarinimicrobiota bacterium]MCF7850772.1 hydrogenase nickel incorporation protein HypB [Candidatus Neomarinimicrobiota bacterium]MCF7904270.1 hydrogenase nickel incorporation protein HypB [Candidatus Neomarinimicrobiota bacterium]
MCDTCGCGSNSTTFTKHGEKEHHHGDGHHHDHDHDHGHNHDHSHEHDHSTHTHGRTIEVEQDVLGENNLLAQRNRGYFEAKNIFALNLVSSPGSGKTTLLEKTLVELQDVPSAVIEGDQQTMNDADRVAATGVPVLQINTGNGCHLDANMIHTAYGELELKNDSVLFIENVGNLVCPALFDLGENKRVVIISVTEGEDKPAKYPTMFDAADICIINKIDLLPYVEFDVARCKEHALKVNHQLEFFELSATTGEGMDTWLSWLRDNLK